MPLSFPLSSRVRCLVRSPFARGFRSSLFRSRFVCAFGSFVLRSLVRSFVLLVRSFVGLRSSSLLVRCVLVGCVKGIYTIQAILTLS